MIANTKKDPETGAEVPVQDHAENSKKGARFGTRHIQVSMLFLLITIAYGMRVNLSVGIVAMTDRSVSTNQDIPTYHWTDKSIILSSFFWGYVVPQIGAGQLAKAYGAKWFLVAAMTASSILSSLIPIMAPYGSWGVIACRVLQGFSQGFMFPSCHTMLGKWVPPNERARLGTFVYAGTSFGTVLSLVITGSICSSSVGWPGAFYLYSALGLVWAIVWVFVGCNSPNEHSGISFSELKYIEASLGNTENEHAIPTPWRALWSSLPVWAVLVAHLGQNWGFSILLTNIPTYMNGVLNYNIEQNGFFSAGPYLLFWLMSFIFSWATDRVIVKGLLSVGPARKIANSIGLYVPAAALIILGALNNLKGDTAATTLALLFIAVGVNSCSLCGYGVNHIDLSPAHAGTLMGITNGLSNIFSIIAPMTVQWIVTDDSNPSQWATVFYIAAGVYILGNTFFVFFGSGEIQPWNAIEAKKPLEKIPKCSTKKTKEISTIM